MTSSSSSSPEIQPAPAADVQERFTYKHATHEEVLEDLSSRFLLNLPDEELSSLERICFQVEQAHWFYEDFVREQNPKFPSLPLKKFSEMLFRACPLLHQWSHDHEQAFNTFMQYKTRVPVCGAIMLNETWEKCILVKGWKSSSGWGFPKGKINEHEPPHECAIREVLEETGYNLVGQINPADVIEMSIKEQLISLFIVPGIPEDFPFKTRTRKEISRIEWFRLTDLPTWKRNKASPGKFYLISPFIAGLKVFITARKPKSFELRNYKSAPHMSVARGAQESSSSSADTGEPETPSPQHSEAVPVDHIIARHGLDDTKGILVEPLDPHFARLLNSLSISASKNVDLKPLLPLDLKDPNRPETPDWSSRIPAFSETLISSPGPSSATCVSTQGSRDCQSSTSLLANDSGLTSRADIGSSDKPLVTTANPVAVSSPSVITARKSFMSSRRSSSIADISPYISRPAEVPASGKRLKQLALLESVAEESSRMTPTLASRELPPVRGPGLSTSVPPPSHARADARALYEPGASVPSVHPIRGTNLPPVQAPYDHPLVGDAFQTRPRSGQLNHSPFTYLDGRGPRNQNEAPSLRSGLPHFSSTTNPPRTPQPTPFLQTLASSYPTPPLRPPAQPTTIYPSASLSENVVASKPIHSIHPPRATPAAHTILPRQCRSPLTASSVQLLSILNGDRINGKAPAPRAGLPSVRTT